MASNCTTQVSVEAGSTWAQRSGISFLKGLRAIERAWICRYAFRSTEPSKKRRVRSPTPRRSFSPSFFFSFTFTSIKSNCTCDWDCPEVKFLPQWLHQNTDFTPNGQDLINIDFILWHVTLAPFMLNQSQQQSFQQGILLIMNLFVPENIFVGFLIKVCIIRVYTHCFLNVIFRINSKAKVSA